MSKALVKLVSKDCPRVMSKDCNVNVKNLKVDFFDY